MENPKLQKLQEIVERANDGLTREEFTNAFKEVLKIVKETKDTSKAEFDLIQKFLKQSQSKMESDHTSAYDTLKGQVDNVFVEKRLKEIQGAMDSTNMEHKTKNETALKEMYGTFDKKHTEKMAKMEGVMARCEAMLEKMDKHMTMMGETMKKERAELADDVQTKMDDIKTEIKKEMEDRISRISRGGGTSAMGVRQAFKYIAHTEEPTGAIDGVNTTYTVSNDIWWVAGFTLNGETIAELPNFTFANKTITFASALPTIYSGKDFEIKYIG